MFTPATPPIESLLVVKEASEILRRKPSTIYLDAAAGRIPCVRFRVGDRKHALRFERSELLAYIRKNRVNGR